MADQTTVWRWTAPRPLYSVMRIAATRPRHRTQMSRRQGNARATHLDSKMVPSGRRAGRAPDHGRFASSPRAVVAVVVVVISCRASTGQSIGSRMTWDGSSRTPGAREEGRRRARRKHERHAGLLAVGGRRVLRRRQHRRGAHRARRERAERQGVRRLGDGKRLSHGVTATMGIEC